MPRPVPVADELSKPFWDACNEHRLLVQNCTACNRMQFPPEKTCRQCKSADNLEWIETSGRGVIDEYTVMHDSRLQAWHPDQPYNTAAIALRESPEIKFFSNLPGIPVDEVPVGANVEVTFVEVSPTQLIPEWRVVA